MSLEQEPKIRFVVATRESRESFYSATATGRSLALYRFPFVQLDLYDTNTQGLSWVYNRAIEKSRDDPAILVFVHDDVYITDFFWPRDLLEGLGHFDIVGVAGNKRRLPWQPCWHFIDDKSTWDTKENLSGFVGHGQGFPPHNLSLYGKPRQRVKILDGVFMACRSETLHRHGLCFDEQFDFHFYDLDFCRQAEQKGLTMGTWSISIVHESKGNFSSPRWREAKSRYFSKWGS